MLVRMAHQSSQVPQVVPDRYRLHIEMFSLTELYLPIYVFGSWTVSLKERNIEYRTIAASANTRSIPLLGVLVAQFARRTLTSKWAFSQVSILH